MEEIQLGDKVKDTITGFSGIAIGKTLWLHGCTRIVVQPTKLTKDGETVEAQSFDQPQLKILKPKAVSTGSRKIGGPRPEPSRW
jgi:hypothetical protein